MSKINIASIGIDIPGLSDNYKSFDSMDSLSSYDIIVFKPHMPSLDFVVDYINLTDGGQIISSSGFKTLKKLTEHWLAELNDALKLNKTVIILSTPNEEIIYSTGCYSPRKDEKRYNVSSDYLYSSILPYYPKTRETKGNEIFLCNNEISFLVKQLYESCKALTSYEVIFTEIEKTHVPLLITKSKQIVGFMLEYNSGGKLIFWPNIDFEYKGSTYEKDGKFFWTKEVLSIGKSFINSIVSLHKYMHSSQEPMPTWVTVESYMTNYEKNILLSIQGKKDKQKKIKDDLEKLKKKLQQEQQLKHLLYAQGKELECAVNYALSILGLKVENYHFKTRDLEIDNLIDYSGIKLIGETEGKDNDAIAVGKIRQLVTNRDEYFMEEIGNLLIEPKCVLFGNPERLKPLAERTLDFTAACKQISVSKKVSLVKTQDLFDAVFYLRNNQNKTDFANKCVEAMMNTESGIVQFPEPD